MPPAGHQLPEGGGNYLLAWWTKSRMNFPSKTLIGQKEGWIPHAGRTL